MHDNARQGPDADGTSRTQELPPVAPSRKRKRWPDLTDASVRALKATDGRAALGDGACKGLWIRCTTSGLKTWSYAYKQDGQARRVTLGEYPAMSLAKARIEVDELRSLKRGGKDPRAVQAAARLERSRVVLTVEQLADNYLAHLKAKGKISWRADERYMKRLKAHVSSDPATGRRLQLGKRSAASITKRDLTEALAAAAAKSKVSANRMQSTLRTMWGWASDRDDVPSNIMAGVKKVGGKERSKDRVLTPAELQSLLAALDDDACKASPIVRLALKGILLTAQRPGEVAGMMVSELVLEHETPHWIIPRHRTKNKKAEHTVPLSPAAVLVIQAAMEASKAGWEGRNDRPVFASRFTKMTHLARHSLSHAVRRILKGKKLTKFTPHDLRRTAATLAQSRRIPRDYVKALLNHSDGDVTETYARWHMFGEKREAVVAIEAAVLPTAEG
ncbi:tyrosine-type recombinase/integrase [Bradyrhizobium iriomotense]|uniref:Integrase n=1 Tax=Bradyrhizobium iriomotense TaxID=441950 RepID=A0ABQ6B7H8_9BRAD|nr:site-specific integrase [Bradyrhizobium iriomotense]GLR87992.1 integrase [Bradyrhizobium iriomotense]